MRIALATVGTAGDVRPFTILARRLVERGHNVTAVSWPVHRTALSQSGVQVEVAGPHADPARISSVAADAAERGPMEQVAILRDFHLADGEAHYRRLRDLLQGSDLVLLHGIHALAQAAAMDLGIPWATAVFDPVLLPTASAPPPGMPALGPGNRLLWAMLDRMLQRASRPLDDVLQRAGSSQRGLPLFRARSPLLHLVACSPALVAIPPDLPATTHVTGAWLDRSTPPSLPADLEAFLADGAPPIVITFGSMPGIAAGELTSAVRAILDGGRRVVVQGPGADASPNFLRTGVVDHRALFPRAALVVHHGGAGTTHATVAAGVPSVVVPHVGDQRYWADRLHRLGVAPAPMLRRGARGERLAETALSAASDPRLRAAVRPLAETLEAEDGVGATVTRLERATSG
jgi:sterol 3beta-glucosyltransferase/vancomycin aglycone glucosyltransferase